MKNKKIIILTLITGILITTIGITYSIFTSSKTGKNSNLIVGDIYMHYNETNELTIENAMPSDTYDKTKYFEFTIDGKNTTTNKDIWYEVVLSKGDNIEGKTRIKDNLLKFRLVEIKDNNETIVVDDKSYDDLTSKRIWVNTINKNTTNEISITYRLYMWISSDTNIGNTDDVDYTMEEWNNIFASIKVNVSGDFNEKYMKVDTNCFKTEENETGLTITDYNSSCGSKIAIPEIIDNIKVTQIASNAFYDKNLVYINIPSSVVKIGAYAFMKNNITSINIPNTVTDLHCKSFDDGVVKNRDMTCVATNESCFTVGTINDGNEVAILNYDATCGTDVIIPSTIKGYPVTVIGNSDTSVIEKLSNKKNNKLNDLNNYQDNSYSIEKILLKFNGAFANVNLTSVEIPDTIIIIDNKAFSNNQLKNVVIPDSVTTISNYAFYKNQLTSITIPDNVITIGLDAFANNQLTSVTIGSGIEYIKKSAFDKFSSSNPNLSKITINKSCSDIKNIQAFSTDTTKYYPWLSSSSPYTASGVTIYGSNNEVCDSF